MSRRWVRVDTTWSQSEWLAELHPECRLVWIELLCYAKAHGTDGRVKASYVALERVTGVTRYRVQELVTAATTHGSLVEDGGEWVIAEWKTYQGDPTGKERVRRHRLRAQGLSEKTVKQDVTPVTRYNRVVTPTETETETKETDISAEKVVEFSPEFVELWKIHHKGSKVEAYKQYRRALKQTDHTTIVRGLKAYVASFRGDFTGAHLFRWLRDERWQETTEASKADVKAHLEAQRRIING
jgi:hypothetical protein